MEPLPVQYHLEVYENSFVNDPSYTIQTTSPPPAISVGDFFNEQTSDRWNKRPDTGKSFRVKEVEHIFWTVERSHVGYKLMACLEIVPRSQ